MKSAFTKIKSKMNTWLVKSRLHAVCILLFMVEDSDLLPVPRDPQIHPVPKTRCVGIKHKALADKGTVSTFLPLLTHV